MTKLLTNLKAVFTEPSLIVELKAWFSSPFVELFLDIWGFRVSSGLKRPTSPNLSDCFFLFLFCFLASLGWVGARKPHLTLRFLWCAFLTSLLFRSPPPPPPRMRGSPGIWCSSVVFYKQSTRWIWCALLLTHLPFQITILNLGSLSQLDATFFACNWKLPADTRAFLLTIDNLSFFTYNWALFCLQIWLFFHLQLEFFAYNRKVCLIKKLNCKQTSSNCK